MNIRFLPRAGLVHRAFILLAAMTSFGFLHGADPVLTKLYLPNKETLSPPFKGTDTGYSVTIPKSQSSRQVVVAVALDPTLKLQSRYGGAGNFRDAPPNTKARDFGIGPLKVGDNIFELKVIDPANPNSFRIYRITVIVDP
ncbi:MAG: cadherin-like beta sandwich domain-containing protein [Verrucomicrobia bacterium]|nr:cadherin-like beta sandwich domain-containing protein [Verrucomicrobiota bacterium]